MEQIADKRAPSLRDEPYSAYCKVCWNPVYIFWIDKEHHGGKCQFGHERAIDCQDAINDAKNAKTFKDIKAAMNKRADDE